MNILNEYMGEQSALQIITLMQIKTMRLHFIATTQMISFKITIANDSEDGKVLSSNNLGCNCNVSLPFSKAIYQCISIEIQISQ